MSHTAVPTALCARCTPLRDLMSAVVNGDQNKEVASKLGISERTVEVHRSRMMSRMGVDSLAGLVRAGVILGLVPAERRE